MTMTMPLHLVRIGTAGWTIPRLYAHQLPSAGSHLERYSRTLTCAEINSTFYRPSRASTWARWAASVPSNFRFAVKAPKSISHDAALDLTRESTDTLASFLEQARLLGPKLGPILFQLPPKQVFDRVRASDFFTHLRALHAGPVVLEPRHATWFSADADSLLVCHSIARAAADPARIPEAAHPGGSTAIVYYRLHGSPRTYYSAYTDTYLESLATTLVKASAKSEAWVIFDNTASGAALGNALTLTGALSRPAVFGLSSARKEPP